MGRSGRAAVLVAVAVLGLVAGADPALAVKTTLTMDEVPSQPIDGLTVGGVTFGFEFGGVPSTDATINSAGPGDQRYTQGQVIEGNSAGQVTMTFAKPTRLVRFGVALSRGGSADPGFSVEIFDVNGFSVGLFPIETTTFFTFMEGRFLYKGETKVKSVLVLFDETSADRFSLDNLGFKGPVPARPSGAAGSGGVAWR